MKIDILTQSRGFTGLQFEKRPGRQWPIWVWVVIWMVAIACATALDKPVAQFVEDHIAHPIGGQKNLRTVLKLPGEFWVLLVAAGIVWWKHRMRWRGALFLVVGAAVSGVNGLIKWAVGRTRPFKLSDDGDYPFHLQPFRGGLEGLFVSKNLSFPSGHAALAFAAATGLAMLWPRYRRWFFAAASVTAVERVLENAHYVSDVVAAMALGIGGVWLISWAMERFLFPREPRGFPVIEIETGVEQIHG